MYNRTTLWYSTISALAWRQPIYCSVDDILINVNSIKFLNRTECLDYKRCQPKKEKKKLILLGIKHETNLDNIRQGFDPLRMQKKGTTRGIWGAQENLKIKCPRLVKNALVIQHLSIVYTFLCSNVKNSSAFIGRKPWSIRGQTHGMTSQLR